MSRPDLSRAEQRARTDEIVRRLNAGETTAQLARAYGVSRNAITIRLKRAGYRLVVRAVKADGGTEW